MPTYEYECTKCHHEFELFESITAEPTKRCPECKGKVKRLLGAGAGILFKGSGFYQTDYRTEGYKKSAESDKSASSSSKDSKKNSSAGSDKKKKKSAKGDGKTV
jgi:putative FmdB family regulatory protein